MKKMRLFLLPFQFFIIISGNLKAQTTELPPKENVITELYILSGSASGNNTVFSWKDFRAMLPQSAILKEDFTGYNTYGYGDLFDHSYFGIQIGMVPGKARRESGLRSPLFRFGFSYERGDYFDASLNKSSSFRYDTLFNSQNQMVYFRDSTNDEYCNMNFSSSSLNAEFSVLLRTNTERRWMFFAGAGLAAGISFNNLFEVSRASVNYLEEYSVGSSSYGHSQNGLRYNNYTYETFNSGNSYVFSAYVPFGVDFRIAKKSEFLKRFHLFSELRPGIKMMDLPDSRTITGTYLLGTIGLRSVWR